MSQKQLLSRILNVSNGFCGCSGLGKYQGLVWFQNGLNLQQAGELRPVLSEVYNCQLLIIC